MRKFHLYLIIVAVAAAVLGGCSGGQTARRLDSAEALMQDSPDSALAVLRTVDTTAMRRAVRARYALLLSQAYDKNYIDLTSDSLISIASSYYASHGDKRSRMLSLYYHARIGRNASDNTGAIVRLLQALDLACELDDDFWIAMSAREIADIYSETFNGADELRYARIADHHFQRAESSYRLYARLDLICALNNSKKYTEALKLLPPLIDSARKVNNKWVIADVMRVAGRSNIGLRRFKTSEKYWKALCNAGLATPEDSAFWGLVYLDMGELPKAHQLMDRLMNYDTQEVRVLKYRVYSATGQPDKALVYLEKIDSFANAKIRNRVTQDMSSSINTYYATAKIADNAKLQSSRYATITIVLFAIIAIASLVLFIRSLRRKLREQSRQYMAIARELMQALDSNSKELDANVRAFRKAVRNRGKYLDAICRYYPLAENDPKDIKMCTASVKRFMDNFQNDPEEYLMMRDMVNMSHAGIVTQLKTEIPSLTDDQEKFFVLRILGFSPKSISHLLAKSKISIVYSISKHLRQKINKLPEPTRYLFNQFL